MRLGGNRGRSVKNRTDHPGFYEWQESPLIARAGLRRRGAGEDAQDERSPQAALGAYVWELGGFAHGEGYGLPLTMTVSATGGDVH
jgi:hypothetical protein